MKQLFWGLLLIAGASATWANQYIHGSVTLNNGETHEGLIRWDDDEETFWSDHFNGEKSDISGYAALSDEVKEAIEDGQKGPKLDLLSFQVELSSLFAEDIDEPDFTLPFAAIKTLTPKTVKGHEGLWVTLHNGDEFFTHEGSNDLTAKVFVNKDNGSVSQFRLNQIKQVDFSTSAATRVGPNQAIYAEVESTQGRFKGRIHWDRDERFVHETLEGTDQNNPAEGEISVAIGDIQSIKRETNAALFIMKDGSEKKMTGTNDVNDGNRGLYIETTDRGRVVLPWEHVTRVTFIDADETDWQPYTTAARKSGLLKASVRTKDGTVSEGNLVFNLAQSSPAEMIRCTVKGMDYYMPLFMIKSIKPVSEQYSEVTLVTGEQLNMYDSASFTAENLGLLLTEGGNTRYLAWDTVEEISFNH